MKEIGRREHLLPEPKIHEADHGHVILSAEERVTKLDEGDIDGSMEKLKKFNAGALTYMGQNSEKGASDEEENQMEEKLESHEERAKHGINPMNDSMQGQTYP